MHTKKYHFKSAYVVLVRWDDGRSTLAGLQADERNKGHASGLMEELIKVFDEEQLTVLLDAKPFGRRKDGLTTQQLAKFYEKYGFVVVDNVQWVLMERVPRT